MIPRPIHAPSGTNRVNSKKLDEDLRLRGSKYIKMGSMALDKCFSELKRLNGRDGQAKGTLQTTA